MDELNALYGSTITPKRAVGYCSYHKAHLTVAMMKQHSCLNKDGCNCHCLKKHDHPYWVEREKIKANKKARKAAM